MEKTIQRSLSKKLDGGYLHVKRHKLKSSQKKKKSGGYSNYLKRLQGGAETKDKPNQSSNEGSKVVSIRVKKLSPKKKSSKKKPKKEIKDIPILPAKPEVSKPAKPEVSKPAKPEVSKPAKPTEPTEPTKPTEPAKPTEPSKPAKPTEPAKPAKPTEPAKPAKPAKPTESAEPIVTKSSRKKQNGIPVSLPVVNKKLKPHKVLKRSKNKSLTKRRKKGKRISVSKVRIMNNREIDTIQDKLKQIRNKSTDEIKQELNKQGLQMSGKSPEILKDIYLYSQLCGITIQRE